MQVGGFQELADAASNHIESLDFVVERKLTHFHFSDPLILALLNAPTVATDLFNKEKVDLGLRAISRQR